jgi:hypothetical protein
VLRDAVVSRAAAIASTGANARELMVRMGHDSERAALIYLHSIGHAAGTKPR